MTATYDTVLQDALRLPLEDRSRIATRLIASVDDDDGFELSPAWMAEIDRRMQAVKNGTATLIPHDEAMESVRKLIGNVE
jgi:putative addiction module component (TIGR02574 family)